MKKVKQNAQAEPVCSSLAAIKASGDMWYKMCVLVYDMCSVATDAQSVRRIESSTDPLYISEPYFTTAEAQMLKAAQVRLPGNFINSISDEVELLIEDDDHPAPDVLMSVEEAIQSALVGFLDKRKASGDARPCGPHDLGPIYRKVFDMKPTTIKEEKFLSRLRRVGLPKLVDV